MAVPRTLRREHPGEGWPDGKERFSLSAFDRSVAHQIRELEDL
jgi:hypothetical protein